jgi:hypothetical protein
VQRRRSYGSVHVEHERLFAACTLLVSTQQSMYSKQAIAHASPLTMYANSEASVAEVQSRRPYNMDEEPAYLHYPYNSFHSAHLLKSHKVLLVLVLLSLLLYNHLCRAGRWRSSSEMHMSDTLPGVHACCCSRKHTQTEAQQWVPSADCTPTLDRMALLLCLLLTSSVPAFAAPPLMCLRLSK